ncbi:MAG: DUF1013 domain-containing protein [Caulobacterales bacterium]|jgi:hypothetical protein
MSNVLMPKATAVWLIEETALSFEQIAEFCGLHPLEVQGIANEDVAKGIRGVDPIAGGFLSREEIEKGEKNPDYTLKVSEQTRVDLPERKRKGARYTPIARRQDRPDAIAWFLRNHPEVPDSQIVKLIGTTKSTIDQVRTRSHWNSSNIKPVDPVSLGLCTQIELDDVVSKSADQKVRDDARKRRVTGETLKPASETVAADAYDREEDADDEIDDDEED